MTKILVVDDSASARESLREALETHGFLDVFEAGDGREALDIFNHEKDIGFIISDCHMPIIDGYMMCEQIFQISGGHPPPILIISTESNVKIKEQFKKLGVIGWIIKPFDKTVIGPILANLVRERTKK